MARGARSSRKRFLGVLEPFSTLRIEVAAGRGELGVLVQAQVLHVFPTILQDLRKMEVAGSALEMIREATPMGESDNELFATIVTLFHMVDHHDDALEQLLICFRLRTMGLLGFAPCFDACGICGKRPLQTQAGMFDPLAGHLVCQACGGAPFHLSATTRRYLVSALGTQWHDLSQSWSSQQLDQARRAVAAFVEYRLERAFPR